MITQRERAEMLAYSLGISIFLGEDGRLSQNGPGEEIRPPASAHPLPRGGDEVLKTAIQVLAEKAS
jgi:hypothetical protein